MVVVVEVPPPCVVVCVCLFLIENQPGQQHKWIVSPPHLNWGRALNRGLCVPFWAKCLRTRRTVSRHQQRAKLTSAWPNGSQVVLVVRHHSVMMKRQISASSGIKWLQQLAHLYNNNSTSNIEWSRSFLAISFELFIPSGSLQIGIH